MSFWDDLLEPQTVAEIRATIAGYAQGAGLIITNWLTGAIGQQLLEAVDETVANATSAIAYVVRSYASLDTATDPGDYDAFNPDNASLTPARGGLSYYGENTYGTVRDEATFASGFFTFDNSAGIIPRTFGPDSLVFTWTAVSPPSPAPTYSNAADATIYTNADGTVTVNAGATLDIPIRADVAGSGSSAPPSSITLTTTLINVTGTNALAVLGQDRETAPIYRARCRLAPARTSLGAPPAIYAYLANTNLDGTPLLNASGNNVNISRVQVTGSSATGIVNAYFGSPTGAPLAEDVTAANENIEVSAFAVPDTITYTGVAGTEVPITVTGTARIKAGPGIVSATVRQAIVDALVAAFPTFPIGGVDQVAGAGVIYTTDLRSIAATAYPGLYDVLTIQPGGATTALAVGQMATYAGNIGNWMLTIVP